MAHIEGGELSGTIDDLIRHAVTKMSHVHFVSNERAVQRLRQLGECSDAIFNIGSPDMDLMFSDDLPTLEVVKQYYEISFDHYGIVMYHPVTTEYQMMDEHVGHFVDALLEDRHNYVVIYPNNDLGSNYILSAYKRLKDHPRFRIFPSIRFEYFLTLLKNADFMIGNSSAGIREAPAYGIPSVNIGSRQNKRSSASSIVNCGEETSEIRQAIAQVGEMQPQRTLLFGKGKSDRLFYEILKQEDVWRLPKQKEFKDLLSSL